VEFDESQFLNEKPNTFITLNELPADNGGENPEIVADEENGAPEENPVIENEEENPPEEAANIPPPAAQPRRTSTRNKTQTDFFGNRAPEADLEGLDFAVPEVTYALRRAITADILPTTLEEAVCQRDGELWKAAADKEFNSLTAMGTWELTKLPPGRKAISCKWVFRIKRKVDNTIDKYKARLVARGFTQLYGVNFTETFAPVV
jgi:hypothetical protein